MGNVLIRNRTTSFNGKCVVFHVLATQPKKLKPKTQTRLLLIVGHILNLNMIPTTLIRRGPQGKVVSKQLHD